LIDAMTVRDAATSGARAIMAAGIVDAHKIFQHGPE